MDTVLEARTYIDSNKYSFNTDEVTYSTIEIKGEKESFVTGYISVPEVDAYNDLITEKALKSMLAQINNRTITLDYEHEAWRDDNSILPAGKIVDAKIDNKGLWVKAVLNRYSPKFKALWGSIKKGFINAFSIAFKPVKTVEKAVGNTVVRLIDELDLLNVALTGSPVNKGAKITDFSMKSVMLKAIDDTREEMVSIPQRLLTKLMEEKSMVEEEIKIEEVVVEAEKVEAAVEENKPSSEEKVEAPAEAVAEVEAAPEAKVEEKSSENKVLAELKSMVESQAKENAEIKAELKALKEKPVFKSLTPEGPVVEATSIKGTMALIG